VPKELKLGPALQQSDADGDTRHGQRGDASQPGAPLRTLTLAILLILAAASPSPGCDAEGTASNAAESDTGTDTSANQGTDFLCGKFDLS
jgi:hypothetical protein